MVLDIINTPMRNGKIIDQPATPAAQSDIAISVMCPVILVTPHKLAPLLLRSK